MTIARRFAAIIEGLCRAVAARAVKEAFLVFDPVSPASPTDPSFAVRFWTHLRRLARRFAALAAGAPPPRPRASRPSAPPERARPPALPRRRGWLLAPVPESRCSASQLRALLDDPEARALICADPRFGRLLRPLCNTLGIRLPAYLAPAALSAIRPRAVPQAPHPAPQAPPLADGPAPSGAHGAPRPLVHPPPAPA
ncbi:hypothetical protein [Acidocella sp. C78]|uniref:hypothetical protein n=1 Tax=Acidocella sp. C78 TaxID=1671486 RepID=UPI00191B9286|nr:hypothetical protein [Acidocella sp. C78]